MVYLLILMLFGQAGDVDASVRLFPTAAACEQAKGDFMTLVGNHHEGIGAAEAKCEPVSNPVTEKKA